MGGIQGLRIARSSRSRLFAAGIAAALACGGIVVSGQPAGAFSGAVTNRACAEGPCSTPTSTTVASSQNPSATGQQVTYTATIQPSFAARVSPGTVEFTDNGSTIGGCAAQPVNSSGQATCSVTYATAGSHPIGANYAGGGTLAPSSGTLPTQTVDLRNTGTLLGSSANPSGAGHYVTYTAVVAPVSGPGTPTGSVGFTDNSTPIGACAARPLDSTGQATCQVSYPSPGNHTIRATYGGDSTFAGSSHTLAQAVAGPPTVSINTPTDGARYAYGQQVLASFSCNEAAGGPGISWCMAPVSNGLPIATGQAGKYSFTVTAMSADGLSAVRTVHYVVLRPSNHFTISRVAASSANGKVTFDLTLPGPGNIDVMETAWKADVARAALLQPAPHRFVFARSHLTAGHAGTISVTVMPNAAGTMLVKHHRHKVRIRLWVTYTPTGGLPATHGILGIPLAP